VDEYDKVDCKVGTEDGCNAKGCCWKPAGEGSDTPWCYYKAGAVKVPHCSLKGVPKQPFFDAEIAKVRQLFSANLDIQGSGMVVAAPDHNTGPGGDYYFAWMRDGALSMHAFLQTTPNLADVETKMDHWMAWVERSETQAPTEGRDVMTEPKFVIPSGKPFPGGWCRPQNDGPGLRAITLMAYAAAKPSVAQRAWTSVKRELDWIVANYTTDGCDLWEEVHSTDFFWNRYTMRKALLQGVAFASSVGKDTGRSSSYAEAAKEISAKLSAHIDADNFVFESVNRRQDTAVIEAFNVGDMEDGTFAPLSKEVIATLVGLSRLFCRAYGLNQQAASANISGVLYGRYNGDSYDVGNPWVLLTASAATLLYRQAEALSKGASVAPEAASSLETLLGQAVTAQNLVGAGDSILNRMKTFLTNGMHMSEQIGRDSGSMTSAKDLTWNYANVLKAMHARSAANSGMAAATASIVI